MKCEHKWVDMEDGSLDKFCVRCRKFSMQAQMSIPKSEVPNVTLENLIKEPALEDLINEINKGLSVKSSMLSRSLGRQNGF